MSNLVSLRLPEDRARQLRNLADAHSTSLSGAVGKLFHALYAHTGVPHNIPSISVNAMSNGLVIRFPDSKPTGFSYQAADQIAVTIRDYLDGDYAGEKTICPTDPGTHKGSFAIWRRGNAIKIAIPMNAPAKSFTHDLAEEFAELLEAEIAKAART